MSSKLRNEIAWFLPALAGIVFAAQVALLSTDPTRQNVIAWSVSAVVALFAIFMTRLAPLDPPRKIRIALEATAAAATVMLILSSILWPRPWTDDKPSVYFDRKLRIGMVQDFPPWNTKFLPGAAGVPAAVGFENELAQFIADHYQTDWEPVRINTDERAKRLASGDVDLVISGFTITQSRATTQDPSEFPVDFASPYFVDTTGVWQNLDKRFGEPAACVVGGTTGNNSLNLFLQSETGSKVQVITASNSGDCMRRFTDVDDPVSYFATDWTNVMAGSGQAVRIRIGDANGTHPHRDTKTSEVIDRDPGIAPWNSSDPPQYYGVAIRNDHPNTCADLSMVINDFLTQTTDREKGFASAYIRNLLPTLGTLQPNWHIPESTTTPEQVGKWVCK